MLDNVPLMNESMNVIILKENIKANDLPDNKSDRRFQPQKPLTVLALLVPFEMITLE